VTDSGARRTVVGEAGGRALERIDIGAPDGRRIAVLGLGAALLECVVPDRDGALADVVLGLADPADYVARREYHGATCGRFANRIGGARFSLDGTGYRVGANEGTTSLHGGPDGFDRRNWEVAATGEDFVSLALTSPDGDGGYPGTVRAEVTYRFDGKALTIDIAATTDRPTVVNIVNHSYWNLDGHGAGAMTAHRLRIDASRVVAVDEGFVPTGELIDVAGTPFDFRQPKPVGRDAAKTPLDGYDHCFCLDGARGTPHLAARVESPQSGRTMEILTTEPGVQFYTAEHFGAQGPAKDGVSYVRRGGLALETQNWPDAPNHANFPSARLDPGETYRNLTEIRFGVT
jgi:aldose 1-epimerase